MKITEVRAVYPRYRHLAASWRTHFWQIAVQVQTDAGVRGWGCGGGGVAAVEVVNRHFRALLLGKDLDDPEDLGRLWDQLYRASLPYGRSGLAIMALSGVDLALWDGLGRAAGLPVYELLGGKRRERIRAYATGPDVAWYRDLGFAAHKASLAKKSADQVVEWAEKARRMLGPEALLMGDAYMSWDAALAEEMARRLAPYNIYWFEDLLTPDDLEGLAALRLRIKPVLLAGGEHDFTEYGFAAVARAQALDLWQPDVTWCGGLTAARRIAALAARHQVPLVPHRGGEIWGLHLLAAGQGEDLAERVMGPRQGGGDRLWLDEPEPAAGYLEIGAESGFGVRINEEML